MSSMVLDFALSEAGRGELLARVHAIGKSVLAAHAVRVDRDAVFPQESIRALREAELLSAYVPVEYGGMGLDVVHTAKICEALGHYCGSSAMIYAMHCIQVACLVHHAQEAPYFRDYLHEIVERQLLLASATTEIGTGGDLLSSVCAVETAGERFTLTKKAPVISYGEHANDILITCRRNSAAPASEQALVLARRGSFTTEALSTWDTLGFRGTCSSGFTVSAQGPVEQIVPTPFNDILSQTMHPYSHIVWGALWTGIAADALNRARSYVQAEARKTPGEVPISAVRLAEAETLLQEMRHNVYALAAEYQGMLDGPGTAAVHGFGFSIRTNNLKVSCSQRIVEIVGRALLICGISGFRNDSKYTLGRHLRDAYGCALMVNNDRITKLNATMLLAHREGL
ncbi:MAG TPA: acyl-CoA dehydrogenase family protein [Pirellulales bacterium]|jgi:acyl-CoA dehydrogenase|nr:acyl-CoA dehydrogenase family protein [Pirellulales bacterium]